MSQEESTENPQTQTHDTVEFKNPLSQEQKERYQLLGTIGAGAMGEILLAREQNLYRKVAYKKVHSEMTTNPEVMQRFLKEAQITAQLDHPNIVPVYGLEAENDGEVGYSMKWVKGKTLKDLINTAIEQYQNHKTPDNNHNLPTLLDHFLKVCDAMHYAHIKGVIHRDLKPANIMIGPYNEVYVMDWGIAKKIDQSEDPLNDELIQLLATDGQEHPHERTQMGKVMGTPRYLSPQQAAGKNDILDGRSDQFTLGLILFELVCLKPAFKAKGQIDLLKKILKVELEPFSHAVAGQKVPIDLQAIINKATQKRPEKRYGSVEDMANDIRRYLRGEAILARQDTLFQKALRWVGQNRELTLAIALGIITVSTSAAIWGLLQQQAALKREQAAQIAAQEYKEKLTQFLLSVGQKAQSIDSQFVRFESLLEGVGGSLKQLIENGDPSNQRYYLNREFYQKDTMPPDLVDSQFYQFKMSTHWNVFKLAPGVEKKQVDTLLKKVSPIRFVLRDALLASDGERKAYYSNQEIIEKLEKGLPFLWVYAGLKEGIQLTYPGRGTFPPEYDTRKRPWFIQSQGKTGIQWLKPYLDVHGTGWVLPCTLPLYDSKGSFLGVSAFEMSLNHIQNSYLNETEPGSHSYLLNQDGAVIVSSKVPIGRSQRGRIHKDFKELKPYPNAQVQKAIHEQDSGYFESEEKVIAYYKIPSLGWYYLKEKSLSEL